jgi:CheY-like chemotaxis protein
MSRVLVVDDDPLMREGLQAWPAGDGLEIVTVSDGRQALLALADRGLRCRDEHASAGNERPAHHRGLRQIDPELQLVAMSGHLFRATSMGPAQNLQIRTTRLGANRALPKPFEPAQAIEAAHACVKARANVGIGASDPYRTAVAREELRIYTYATNTPRPFFFHAAVLRLVAIQKTISAVSYRLAPSSQIEIPAESPHCDDDPARRQNAAALVELLRRAGFDCHLVAPGRDPLPLPRARSPVQQPRSLLSDESDADSVSEREITSDFPH